MNMNNTAGPFIKYTNLVDDEWLGSVLFLTKKSDEEKPTLRVLSPGLSCRLRPAKLLDTCLGWHFWRFEVAITLGPEETAVEYEVSSDGTTRSSTFYVQAKGQPFHLGYTSCNGISLSIPADHHARQDPTYCWRDILQLHKKHPIHVLIGGGDQVYSDGVWKKEAFVAWGDLHRHRKRAAPWTQEHQEQATAYYLENYLASFTAPVVRDAYASLPSYMIWDDHDIWDGYGSYSKKLQACEFFSGLFAVAKRFYLLFQLHTTEEAANANEQLEWIDQEKADGYHSVKSLGPQVAAIGIDMRSKRTKHRIIPESTYRIIEEQMMGLPEHVEHVIVLSGVPVVFPSIFMAESILFGMLALFKRSAILRRAGRRLGVLDQFDQPEILDDLLDGWASSKHKDERNRFLTLLQRCALAKRYRVSILSGDAHVGGVGEIYGATRPRLPKEDDELFTYQIISSAVMNSPPPPGVVSALTRTNFSKRINHHTRSKMQKAFESSSTSSSSSMSSPSSSSSSSPPSRKPAKLLDQRNWCEITATEDAGLRFSLRAERPGEDPRSYEFIAPRFPTRTESCE